MGSRWRWRETALLILPCLFFALGLFLLTLTLPTAVREGHVRSAVIVGAILLIAHLVLVWRSPAADQLLLPLVAMLGAIGLLTITRLAPDLAIRQALWMAAGLGLMIATVILMPRITLLQDYKYTSAVAGLLLVAPTFLLGVDPNGSGARLWLGVGSIYFQPSEVLKVLLVVFLAGYLDDKRELLSWSSSRLGGIRLPPLPYLGPLVAMLGVSLLLMVGQRDLGATLLLFGVFLAMLYVASSRGVYVWAGLLALGVGGYLCYLAFPHVQLRVNVWLDPWSRAQNEGYQIVQGLVAVASGGIIGAGLGQGYPNFVPAVQTDYVIVAIAEEMGLAGALAVIGLFMLLVSRGFRIALRARDSYSFLLATGLTSILAIQTLVILGGTLKLIPLTGITLPFISYGGSSILTNFLILALLLRISADGGDPVGA